MTVLTLFLALLVGGIVPLDNIGGPGYHAPPSNQPIVAPLDNIGGPGY